MSQSKWPIVALSELTEKIMVGIASAATHAYVSSGIPMLRNLNIKEGGIDETEVLYIDEVYEFQHRNKRLREGDIITVRTGYPGISAVVPKKYEGAQCFTSLIIRPNEYLLNPHYFCQVINSEYGKRLVTASEAGGAQKNLNAGSIESFPVPLPSLKEQQNIVRIVSIWDQAIDTTKRLIEKSQKQKQSLMQLLLSGRRRFTGAESRWKYVDFDAVFERIIRKNSVGISNVLTISGEHGLISQRDYFSKSVASANLTGYTLLDRRDFAYNKSYSAGYPMGAIKPLLEYDAGVVSSLYLCFRLRDDVDASLDFFRHYFEAGLFNQEIEGIAQEGARNHGLLNVSVTDFFKLRLHIPSGPEQRRIAEVINVAEAEESHYKWHLKTLLIEKQALMQQLLTGKRRVHLPEVELEAQA